MQPNNEITSYSTKKLDITSLVCLFYWGKGIKKRRRVISQIKGITGWRTKSGRNKTNDRPNAKFHWLS